MRLILNLVVLSLLIGSFQSCVSKKKYDELMAAKEATDQALAETQSQVQTLQNQNQELQATLESEKQRLNGEIAGLRTDLNNTKSQIAQVQEKLNMTEKELNDLKMAINGTFEKYKNSGLTLEDRNGRLVVMTKQPIQYRVGSSSLSRDERKALEELANVLKANPELKLLVEGHTDNLKYAADSGMDNWDLSVMRAMNVARQLIRNGVKPEQLGVVGRGETMPVGPNDSTEGRQQNRRTVVSPDIDLAPLMKGTMKN